MTKTINALVLSLMSSITPAQAAWEALPPLPEPCSGFICGTLDGEIIVAGGTRWVDGKKVWLDKIWRLDLKSLKWMAKGTLPHPLGYAVCGQWKDGVIVAGGFDGARARSEVWHLDPGFELNPLGHLKTAVSIAQGGICNDELVIIGGTPDPAKIDALSAHAQGMLLPGGAPKDITAPDGTPRGIGASTIVAGRLCIFGGAKPDPVNEVANLSDAWTYDASSGRWQALKPYPFRVRGIACAPLDKRRIYLAGGYGGEADDFTDKAFVFDLKTETYTASIPLPLANCTTLVVCDAHVYAIGGEPAKKTRTDKCWRIPVEALTAGK